MTEKQRPRRMAAAVTLILLALFGFVLLAPAFTDGFNVETGMLETLKTLATAAVFYWIGTTQNSVAKDDTIRQQALATPIQTAPSPVSIVSSDAEPVIVSQAEEPRPKNTGPV